MGSQSHREDQTNQKETHIYIYIDRIIDPEILVCLICFWFYRWFWLPIGSEILVFLFLFVFSMALVTHWF